jgi:pyochelin synthetase
MQNIQQEPIAIIGMGCHFPQAANPQEFWALLCKGKNAIREVPADRWDVNKFYDSDPTLPGKMVSRWGGFLDQIDQFDWRAFRILPREIISMDPQHRLLLEVAWEALEDAGLPFEEIAGSQTSVSIGISWSDYMRLQTRNWSQLNEYAVMGSINSSAANRISYMFDLKGPSISIDTACTSSLIAIQLACQSLWTGDASLALAGGVNLVLSPDGTIMFSKSGLLSRDGHCKTLDVHANGFVRGEGAGIVVLKPLSQVKKSDRVYALIRGIAINHNGQNERIIVPSQKAQEALLRDAYQKAGIKPSEVDYVELHGTGFRRGDVTETQALKAVLGTQPERTHPCLVGSVKTNIGHLEAASGIAGLIKVALSLYHREIPPILNLKTLNPDSPIDNLHLAVPQTRTPWQKKANGAELIAGVTALALSGSNAHAVLSAHISDEIQSEEDDENYQEVYRLLPLSARSEQSLHSLAQAYLDFLQVHATDTASSWRDICYSASVRRTHHRYRLAVAGRSPLEASEALRLYVKEHILPNDISKNIQELQIEIPSHLETLKLLYISGHDVGWSRLYQEEKCHHVSLPPYCWQRERLWPDWLDVEEISTPPEKRLVDPQFIARGRDLIDHTHRSPTGRSSIEQNLIELWAEILGLEHVSASNSFFELGGHSLLAMQLLMRIRNLFRVTITLRDLLEAPTPSACAELITLRNRCDRSDSSITGNSLPSVEAPGDYQEFALVNSELPLIKPDPKRQYEPFPMTDVQQAYWVGRHASLEIGNVGNHGYIEVEATDLDLDRFNQALQRLIERHDMLRAILLPDGRQQVLEHVPPFGIKIVDLSGQDPQDQACQLEQIRHMLDHQVLPVEQWPAFELWISRLDERLVRLHLSIESIFVDAWSLNTLIQEFIRLYHDLDLSLPTLTLSFRDYVLAEVSLENSTLFQHSREYWLERLPSLPPAPDLPLASSTVDQPRFVHREARLDREHWQRLKAHASKIGLTPSGVLLAAFAEVITRWSKTARFSLNLSTFNRLPLHPQVNEIVGDFTSLLVLAVDHTTPDTFENRAKRVQEQLWNDLDHSYYSGIRVLRELAKAEGVALKAIMPIVFTSLLIQDTASPIPLPWGKTLYCVTQTPQVWLDHQVVETGGELVFHWQSVDAIFPAGLIDAMFGAYCRLLQRLATVEESWSEPVRDLLPEQQRTLLAQINATEAPVSDKLLHTFFLEQVAQRPDQLAVISPTRRLTYKEVHCGALQLAHQLRQWGVHRNQLVGVVMEKGWEQVVAVLGVLLSGAAYLPIDASLPKERLRYILGHGEVAFVLTQSWISEMVEWPEDLRWICVDSLNIDEEAENQADVINRVPDEEQTDGNKSLSICFPPVQSPDDLAYVIYTSGSTGLPKGVMITHRGAVNTILDINQRFGITSTDRVLALSALNFDLSVYDIFGILAAGGAIIMPTEQTVRDPVSWLKMIKQERVTIWNTVPALLQLLVEYAELRAHSLDYSYLRLALLSGDWIPLTLPERLKDLCHHAEVVSLGGATEASIWSILYPIISFDPSWKSIPYGCPMNNQQFFVLGEDLEPCPVWVPGQLYIGGLGLAKGYWRDKEKTQSSFFEHPQTGTPLYRTGDMGRFLPNGTIEFLGREDSQVKVQGHRIELGEIETTLARYPGVQEAVVSCLGENQSEKRLAAYIVPKSKDTLTASDLHRYLAKFLPDYMIPTSFHLLDALPLTANGKVNRKALPSIALSSDTSSLQVLEQNLRTSSMIEHKPQSALVVQVSQLVAKVLKVEQIDPARNLLEYGTTSMDIFRIANLLDSQLHVHLEFGQLFHFSNINAIAAYCKQYLSSDEIPADTLEPSEKNGTAHSSASFNLLIDPVEREQFKQRQAGLRRTRSELAKVELMVPELEETVLRKYLERRSYRTFLQKPIPFRQFSEFLGCLRQIALNGKLKYQWGSAGGLYPVQIYAYVKSRGVEGIDRGIYYYHPVDHNLTLITPHVQLDRNVFGLTNQHIFDQAAFAIFLIGQMKAIEPMYGELSRDFCLIEAGLITQLLETSAPPHQIALCQIGRIGFGEIEHLFSLEEGCIYLHSLLGGALDIASQEMLYSTIAEQNDWDEGTI